MLPDKGTAKLPMQETRTKNMAVPIAPWTWLASKTRNAFVSITMSICGCDACYDCEHNDDYC